MNIHFINQISVLNANFNKKLLRKLGIAGKANRSLHQKFDYSNFLSTNYCQKYLLFWTVFAILDKIPAREVPEWDRKE
jgi:hypothetical protein